MSRVVPERVQLALGELGEALMKDGEAKDACIERAIAVLKDPMLDPAWTPQAGYSHAANLMRLHDVG